MDDYAQYLPPDPWADDPEIRLLLDVLDPDPHDCWCGHPINEHAEQDSVVGHCEACSSCDGYSPASPTPGLPCDDIGEPW